MSTERQENNDGGNKEVILTRPTPQWMAGVWEIGGEMGFDYYTKKGHVYVYPRMSVTDNDVETSQYLDYHYPSQRDLLHRGNSWQWIREGGNVVDITKIMYPYVVRRKSIVEAFIAWGGTNSRDRRVAIADDFNTQQPEVIDSRDYYQLLEDRSFIAGIVDSRGRVYRHKDTGYDNFFPQFAVNSDNLMLLLALQHSYGGKCYTNLKYDESGKEKSHSHSWAIENQRDINKLLEMLTGYLRLPNRFALE